MAYFKRRGSMLVFLAIIGIVISVFIIIVFPSIAKSYASGKFALKVAAVRDIALTLDTIYAYPYDLELIYDVDLSDFRVRITQNAVHLDLIELSLDPTTAKYSFTQTNKDELDFIIPIELEMPKKINFKKTDGKVSVTKVI